MHGRNVVCSPSWPGFALGLRGVLVALLDLGVGIARPSSSASVLRVLAMRFAMRNRPSMESYVAP